MRWLLLLLVLNVATCGQKGPLEVPQGRLPAALAAASAD